MTPYSPNYYDQFREMPVGFLRDPPEEEPDGVQVDFSALQSIRNVSEKTAATLMPSVDAVTLVCANVSRVLYLRTDDLQSKAGASTFEIENTAAELSSFAMVLGNLREILQSSSQVISDQAFQNMNALLVYCKKALQKIQSVISTSRKTPSRLNFLKRNSLNSSLSKAKPVRLNLECLKTSLTAMMSTIILAGRENERNKVHSNTHAAENSLETLVNDKDTDRGSQIFKTMYELDAAVERITSKLEDDIFANSRAVKRWQEAERREFDDLYMRNTVPDNASRVSPASQWISTLVPFQPTTAYMKRIAGPMPPKAISYRGEEVVASGSGYQINEDEEEARIAAVIKVLLAKWTESQPGPPSGISNRDSTMSDSSKNLEKLSGVRSDMDETQPLGGDGVLADGMLDNQHNSEGGNPASKRTKHVSFKDDGIEDHQTPDQPNGVTTDSTQGSDGEREDGIRMDKNSANGDDQNGAMTLNDSSKIEQTSGKRNDSKGTVRGIYDIRERYADEYIGSGNTKHEDPDDLPKTGWEQVDEIRPAFRIPDPRRDPSLYGSDRAQFRDSDTPHYSSTLQTPRPIATLAYEDPYGYGQDITRPSSYPPTIYYPPPPAIRLSTLPSDEEEPPRDRGIAGTIHSSRDPSRSYSRRSQSERYKSSGRYPRRRDSSSKGYSDSEGERVIQNDKSKAVVLRANPLSSVLHQLQTELREAKAMIEQKNAELRNRTDSDRVERLQTDLYTALEELEEARAAAERRADSDERNSALKTDQIEDLEASNAEQADQIEALEASNAAQADQIEALETSNTAQAEQITDLEASITANSKVTRIEARIARREAARIERLERGSDVEDAASPDEEIVEVIEEVDGPKPRAPPRKTASSEFSYYTESERQPKNDKTWVLAQSMIVLFSLAFGLSAILATYIHSDNDVMLNVLGLMLEPRPEFTLQAQSHT
jgi:hypothetical protein